MKSASSAASSRRTSSWGATQPSQTTRRQDWHWCSALAWKQAWHIRRCFPSSSSPLSGMSSLSRIAPKVSPIPPGGNSLPGPGTLGTMNAPGTIDAEPFVWEGEVPLGDAGAVAELAINRYMKGEMPEVTANDPLPEVGGFVSVPLEDLETSLYRYVLVPRGLRALYSNKRMLGVYSVYFEAWGQRFLLRLKADQEASRDARPWLKALVDQLELAYVRGDTETLAASALYDVVRRVLQDSRPLTTERRLFLAQAACEIGDEIRFLYGPPTPEPGPYRLRLPAAPGDRVGLALRLQAEERHIRPHGVEVHEGRGVKGKTVRLRQEGTEGEVEHRAKIDAEGWAQFPGLDLHGPRRLRFRVGPARGPAELEGTVVLRWGRALEAALDSPVPELSGAASLSSGVDEWRRLLAVDLERSWDPDRGLLRCVSPGQVLEDRLEHVEALEALGGKAPWRDDYLAAATDRLARRGSEAPALVRYALGALGVASARKAARELLQELRGEEPRVWTLDACRAVYTLVRAVRRRPDKVLAGLARQAAEDLAHRVEAEPEPTWRYRAHGRPRKTFKANPDIAQPHAEAVLALIEAAEVLGELGWLEEVAEAQGLHLLDHHPTDGQPPGWVLGSWKDRARLETPVRIGWALDRLVERRDIARVRERAKRVRALVWSRFLGYHASVEIEERMLLVAWLAATQGGTDAR